MKFTSEDLMKAMGLQVGDRVEIGKAIYKVDYDKHSNDYYFKALETGRGDENLYCVIDLKLEYQILPKPKRVGDLKCDGKCPFCKCIFVCTSEVNALDKTLYEVLELGIATFKTPKRITDAIYKVVKDELDKEVEENDKR